MSEAAGGSMAAAGQHVSSRGAQVKSVKWSCCRARRRSRYVDDDTQQLGSHQQWQIGRATAQRSCAVSGQLKRMAERTGILAALLGAARLVCCAQITADRYCLEEKSSHRVAMVLRNAYTDMDFNLISSFLLGLSKL